MEWRVFRHTVSQYRLHYFASVVIAARRSETTIILGVFYFGHLPTLIDDNCVLVCKEIIGPVWTHCISNQFCIFDYRWARAFTHLRLNLSSNGLLVRMQ